MRRKAKAKGAEPSQPAAQRLSFARLIVRKNPQSGEEETFKAREGGRLVLDLRAGALQQGHRGGFVETSALGAEGDLGDGQGAKRWSPWTTTWLTAAPKESSASSAAICAKADWSCSGDRLGMPQGNPVPAPDNFFILLNMKNYGMEFKH